MTSHHYSAVVFAALLLCAGCAGKPYDYTNFRAHPPRSIVVLPPVNHSTDVRATYGFLSTVTRPLAEMGFYVLPVAEVDEFMKENGLPTAGDMQQAPLDKIRDILGADAVLYLTINNYGTKYEVITSVVIVSADAKLVDVKTGMLLWQGTVNVQESSSSSDPIADLIVAAVDQIINSSTDQAHELSRQANFQLITTKDHGVLFGPYYPKDKQ